MERADGKERGGFLRATEDRRQKLSKGAEGNRGKSARGIVYTGKY